MRTAAALAFVIMITPHPAEGAVTAADSARAGLSVVTPGIRGMIIVDSSLTGFTPFMVDTLPPGRHVLRILPLPITRWDNTPIVDTVLLTEGETLSRSYTRPSLLRISSLPSGAEVWRNRTALGVTPLTVVLTSKDYGDTVTLQKEGYTPSFMTRVDFLPGDTIVPLVKSWPALEKSEAPRPLLPNEDRPAARILIPALGSIVAGTVSAYCKIHADDLNSQYLISGDPGLKNDVKRYDLVSAIALVVMEAGIGLLAYYLLSP